MTAEVELRPLRGRNPLGFLAALGALDVATRKLPECHPTLRWSEGLAPRAILAGPESIEHLAELVDADRSRWATSPVLAGPPGAKEPADLKPTIEELRSWATAVLGRARKDRTDADLFESLLAEGAVAGKGDAKPTYLHFTAGQQRFLAMVRQLRDAVGKPELGEALRGPWRYASRLPVLGWDNSGERIYALRGTNPAKEKRTGVPGADWLAFLGLCFLPVVARGQELRTTGCKGTWKEGSFTWPLWSVPIGAEVVRSLLGDAALAGQTEAQRRARGVSAVLRAHIRRSDQGGYGSFGPAELVRGGEP